MNKSEYGRLFSLLAEYDTKLDRLKDTLSQGFYNLSKANFYNKDSITSSYGSDYWDSNFTGTEFIEIDSNGVFRRNENNMFSYHVNGKKEVEYCSDKDEGHLRNRKLKNSRSTSTSNAKSNLDPLYMFGGGFSIPSALRESQSEFKKCIPILLDLVNCRKQLNEVLNQTQNIDDVNPDT